MADTFSVASKWPGLHDGGLLLPLPQGWLSRRADGFSLDGFAFRRKDEFHVTLLDRATNARAADALGEARIRTLFGNQVWVGKRTGNGVLVKDAEPASCMTLVELVELPAMTRFRAAVSRDAGLDLPDAPAHVTLHVAGDTNGIGLPDRATLGRLQVANLRLPGIANRRAPGLSDDLRASYCAAEYALDGLGTSVRIGNTCPVVTRAMRDRGVERAVIVTAYNPFSEAADDIGNRLRQQLLIARIADEGLQAIEAEGRDPSGQWQAEPSLLVFGTSPALEAALLRDFEQHALVLLQCDAPAGLVVNTPH